MKQFYFLLISIIILSFFPNDLNAHEHDHNHDGRIVFFEENKGQWGDAPLYRARFHGGYAYFEDGRITYVVKDMEAISELLAFKMKPEEYKRNNNPDPIIPHHAYQVVFEGANQNAEVFPEGKTSDYVNYFLGSDQSRWASRVRKYSSIEYQDLYDGIDLRFDQFGTYMKYTFTVAPQASPDNIQMRYDKSGKLKIKDNRLIINTSVHDVVEYEPYAFQINNGDTVDVACEYSLEDNIVSYKFPRGFDEQKKLYIDPTLVFSTFSGSTADNWGYTASYDSEGNAFGGGTSFGSGYPVSLGAYDENYGGGGCDMVITKFDTLGSSLIYSTYLGGSGVDVPHSLICNSFDELIILGTTGSSNFPVLPNALDTSFNGGTPYILTSVINYANGSDITISRLSNDGSSLNASTYVGGTGNDGLNSATNLRYNYADEVRGEVMVDENDMIYVATSTNSLNFPMAGNGFLKSAQGMQDGVVFKMSPNLDGIFWSNYFGGSGDDAIYNINVGEDASVYVAGGTTSNDLPVTPNAYQSSYQGGSADGFIAYISPAGDQLDACTYYGSSAYDQVYFIDQDLDQGIYVLGQTAATGSTFIFNAPWSQPGGGQFVSQVSKHLKTVTFSTAFGNAYTPGPDISPTTFMVDYCSSMYIAGWGGGLNNFGGTAGLPVTANAYQTTTDNNDYYFMVLDKDAQSLQYATFFGGTQNVGEHVDGGTSRFSKKGAIYQAICGGCGGYSDVPTTPGAWSSTNNSSNCNLAVLKFGFDVKAVIADFKRPFSGCVPYTIQFENRSFTSGTNTHYIWDFGDGDSSFVFEPSHTYTTDSLFTITLTVIDSTTCNISDSIQYSILVLDSESDTMPVKTVCKGDSVEIGIDGYNSPNVIYAWSPVWYIPPPYLQTPPFKTPVPFMDTLSIGKPRVKVLPRNDTTFYLSISNGICTDSVVQFIDVIDLEADAGPDLEVCDSVITMEGKGTGANALYYIWSNYGNFSDTLNKDISSGIFDYRLKGNGALYLKVTDGKCEDVDTVNIDFRIDILDSTAAPLCFGDTNGVISVSVSGGTAPYTYSWNNGKQGSTISGLGGGTYTVTVMDADSCIAVKDITLTEPAILQPGLQVSNAPCVEVCIGEIVASPAGGTAPYSYNWSSGHSTELADQLCVGDYTVTITDANGCIANDSAVVEDASINFNFEARAKADTIYEGQSTVVYTTDTLNYNYSWLPVAGLKTPNEASSVASPTETTTYILSVSDQYGCTFIDSVTIVVRPVTCDDPYIFLPNAFTPNGDGKNDVLYLRTQYAEEAYFAVYNRWGEKVFETDDVNRGWDGTIKGKRAETGVYVYKVRVICFTGEVYEDSGNVTLIR